MVRFPSKEISKQPKFVKESKAFQKSTVVFCYMTQQSSCLYLYKLYSIGLSHTLFRFLTGLSSVTSFSLMNIQLVFSSDSLHVFRKQHCTLAQRCFQHVFMLFSWERRGTKRVLTPHLIYYHGFRADR